MTDPTTHGSLSEKLQDAALRSVLAGAMRLPYERRVPLMGRLVSRALGPLAGYKRRAMRNLAMIRPDLSAQNRTRIADMVCDNFGRTLIENYSHTELAARLQNTRPTGDGVDAVAQAASDGRPIIFVTGHFGNFEAPRHVLTQSGLTIGGLYRPMSNGYVDAHYRKTMTSWGGPVFAQGKRGTMGFARHIKTGGMGTLLFDVHVTEGTAIPFLGHDALTSLSAADMALRFDALLVPYFGIRQPDGLSFKVEVDAPIPHDAPLAMMQRATYSLEQRIARHPGQWFWVHRRWKPGP
ncbi:lysophospholipid acyltransferase family protein [Loktanella sp. SALINAS62]|uniref:lysophospholipid acyltransferase family protein n=1 Tax=Loktanella sp. SALINAS62 TaxID=2706124 RepID=UPI001B8ADB2D|nr:lysophospholipid acyltransferase family protein [Loktanella sp. SALINAS62]MBS1303518.1 lysophospholipid acyltransferase family protein [Loktanella sp. SALINAS62]